MPNRRQIGGAVGPDALVERRDPQSWVAADGTWPNGPFFSNSPLEVIYAAAISINLRAAIGTTAKAEVARQADLARSTVYDILTGRSWPDFVSLVKLSDVLETSPWPEGRPTAPLSRSRRT